MKERKKERKEERKEGRKKKKKEERADRNRSPSTIARTGPFCNSRAWKPLTPTFSDPNSTRPENETHEQLTWFTIQARIARMRSEAPQDVSSRFLRARMVDVRGENRERMLMTKNGEGKLYFANHSFKMQERFQRNKTCDTGNTDELRRSCYADRKKNASTHRCKTQDLSHATGTHRRKLTSARR